MYSAVVNDGVQDFHIFTRYVSDFASFCWWKVVSFSFLLADRQLPARGAFAHLDLSRGLFIRPWCVAGSWQHAYECGDSLCRNLVQKIPSWILCGIMIQLKG